MRTPLLTAKQALCVLDIRPDLREFLDGLAEMIADLIREDEGEEAPSIEAAVTIQQGAESC